MTALLTGAGRYDRRAIMRKAHAEFRATKRRGQDWTFARCLRFAWAVARGQRSQCLVAATRRIHYVRPPPLPAGFASLIL